MGGHGLVAVDVVKVLNGALTTIEKHGSVVEEVALQTLTLNATFRTLRGLGTWRSTAGCRMLCASTLSPQL